MRGYLKITIFTRENDDRNDKNVGCRFQLCYLGET